MNCELTEKSVCCAPVGWYIYARSRELPFHNVYFLLRWTLCRCISGTCWSYSVVDTSKIFYFECLDLNLHLEMHCANCYCCILCYTYHAHSYIHCVNQQVCSVIYSKIQIRNYNTWEASNSYMFWHQIAIHRNTPWGWLSGAETCRSLIVVLNCILLSFIECICWFM